ncbi:MAG: hypothetical protein ACTSR9_16450 [Candidatus Thorarchaeota archaeon]
MINSKPAKNTTTQLDAYEKLLVQEYKTLVPSDPTPPENLWKGVVVLDSDQDPLEVFEAFQDLLANLSMGLVNDLIDSTNLTSYVPDSDNPNRPLRLALLLTASNGPFIESCTILDTRALYLQETALPIDETCNI